MSYFRMAHGLSRYPYSGPVNEVIMKSFLAILLLVSLGSSAAYSQKWRIGQPPPHAQAGMDYPVKAHISAIRLRNNYVGAGRNETLAYTDVVINGVRIELCGALEPYPGFHIATPLPGDYQARLLEKKGVSLPVVPKLGQQYELVMSDRALWRVTVTGISE
jgi:hypothetical protein